jgi:hypothetical protein
VKLVNTPTLEEWLPSLSLQEILGLRVRVPSASFMGVYCNVFWAQVKRFRALIRSQNRPHREKTQGGTIPCPIKV